MQICTDRTPVFGLLSAHLWFSIRLRQRYFIAIPVYIQARKNHGVVNRLTIFRRRRAATDRQLILRNAGRWAAGQDILFLFVDPAFS